MSRRISIRRIIGAIVAAVLVTATVFLASLSYQVGRQFSECLNARPATLAVDLSRPGRATAPFHQTSQFSYAEAFYVTVKPKVDPGRSKLLRGLDGTITISDLDGHRVQSWEMDDTRVGADEPTMLKYGSVNADGEILLACFRPFALGDYTVTVEVRTGAAALAGAEQTIHAQYVPCGMERIPAQIVAFLAWVCGIPGFLLGVVVATGFIRYGLSKPPTKLVN